MRNDDRPRNYRKDTLLTHLGRNPEANHGAVNPPVYHASTILSKNMAEWESQAATAPPFGGRALRAARARRRTFALEEVLAKIEGGYRAHADVVGARRGHRAAAGLLGAGDHLPDGRFASMARRAISATGADTNAASRRPITTR